MLDHTPDNNANAAGDGAEPAAAPPAKAARRAGGAAAAGAAKAPAKRAPRKAAAKKAAPAAADQPPASDQPAAVPPSVNDLPAAPDQPSAQPADQPTVAGSPEPVAVPAKKVARTRKAPAKKATKAAGPAATAEPPAATAEPAAAPAEQAAAPAEQAPAPAGQPPVAESPLPAETGETSAAEAGPSRPPAKRTPRKRVSKAAVPAAQAAADRTDADQTGADQTITEQTEQADQPAAEVPAPPVLAAPVVLFQPPAAEPAPRRRRGAKRTAPEPEVVAVPAEEDTLDELPGLIDPDADLEPEDVDTDDLATDGPGTDEADETADSDDTAGEGTRRRRRRGRRGRGNRSADNGTETDPAAEAPTELDEDDDESDDDHADEVAEAALSASARRRRRRRRSSGADGEAAPSEDDPPNTVVHVRDSRSANRDGRGGAADDDGVRGVKGSTRLEAKRQRRRDNRDTGRRRAPILTEAEFLARREAVDRVMAVRQTGDRTQIAVLEDDILVEHYVTRASASSAVGNVYLGRVQNVLPSMEAAFVDIGRGRNGVLYAGEVNWDTAGLEGKSRSIENALSAGDLVMVQVTKDPIGHKGARLTSQISLPGRFVVYVPGGGMTGISRKLPDVERSRLKAILKKVVPDEAGVIVRTAAEGASEQDLVSDVERLKSEWESISAKAARAKQSSDGPSLLHGEPDLAIRVVRDIFNDDFSKLVVAGAEIHRTIGDYVRDIAPDLADRISRHTAESDLFRDLRVDEQLAKALDRKVWLPSGGSLVIDRTEAMTVVDVNTGKYTGSGGNLEQTVTRNNLEAAEEIVRQLRLRDIGGIVVIDFIDMVLESNRDLVLRRLTECLGRDRTKHQVAEVTSLGLVQMTRKRVGEGLLEAFSEPCQHCNGRGVIVHLDGMDRKSNGATPAAAPSAEEDRPARGRRGRKTTKAEPVAVQPDPAELAAEAEKRRAAASAIAAIAAATGHHDEAAASAPAQVGPESARGSAESGTVESGAGSSAAESSTAGSSTAGSSTVGSSAVGSSPAEPAAPTSRRTRTPRRAVRQATAPAVAADPATGTAPAASDTASQPSQPAASQPSQPAAQQASQPAASQPSQPAAQQASQPAVAAAPPAAAAESEPVQSEAAQSGSAQPVRPRRRRAASRPAGPPVPVSGNG